MTPRTVVAVAAAVAVTLLSVTAAAQPTPDAGPEPVWVAPDAGPAEPEVVSIEVIAPDAEPVKVLSPSLITTDGGTHLRLPPGRFVTEQRWSTLDTELRRLQDAETRLTAENVSLMGEANTGWGWGTITMVLGGVALGAAGGYWLSERY